MTPLTVEMVSPDQLVPYARNARTHSKKQIAMLARSISANGFRSPVLVTGDHTIMAGHARVEAAKLLGLSQIPVVRFVDMTPQQIKAFVLADNRLAEFAGWDFDLVTSELQELIDADFEIEATGFVMAEVDRILEADARRKADPGPEDSVPMPAQGPPVSRPGDLWHFGPRENPRHRLLVGDARDGASFDQLMAGERAAVMITDPPYNVRIAGHVSGLGRSTHREFMQASGELDEAGFVGFLEGFLRASLPVLMPGALSYVFMDWRHLFELQSAARSFGLRLLNICVWNKTNAGMGSLYRSQHELCLIFKSGDDPHCNNVELGKHGRSRTNVWTYAGANTFRKGREQDLADHPTVKPAQMVADAIRDVTRTGDVVLDPFCGSGTILIAADMTGRKARAIEIDPVYADVAIRRFEAFTGKTAWLAATGESFEAVAERRGTEPAC